MSIAQQVLDLLREVNVREAREGSSPKKSDDLNSILLAIKDSSMGKYPIGNKELTAKVKELEAAGKISYDKYNATWVKGKGKSVGEGMQQSLDAVLKKKKPDHPDHEEEVGESTSAGGAMYNIVVVRNGKESLLNKKPMNKKDAEDMQQEAEESGIEFESIEMQRVGESKEELLDRLKTKSDNHDFFSKWMIARWEDPKNPSEEELADALEGADLESSKENIQTARDFYKREYL